MYTEMCDNYRVPPPGLRRMALQTSSYGGVRADVGWCGLTEGRVSAWQRARQKDETSKKIDAGARKEGEGRRRRGKNEHGPR